MRILVPLSVERSEGDVRVFAGGRQDDAGEEAGFLQGEALPVMDVEEVLALEQRIATESMPLAELMRNAASALARFIEQRFPVGTPILLLCGSGNNAGDGWVAAYQLAWKGYQTTVLATCSPEALRTEPAHSMACGSMSPMLRFSAAEALAFGIDEAAVKAGSLLAGDAQDAARKPVAYVVGAPHATQEGYAVIIDCLLGTGFDGSALKPSYREAIRFANSLDSFRLACDVPSGMSAQTGAVSDTCFKADATVTMLAVKRGLLEPSAAPYVGDLYLAPLS